VAISAEIRNFFFALMPNCFDPANAIFVLLLDIDEAVKKA
jgi:hypothetical protein